MIIDRAIAQIAEGARLLGRLVVDSSYHLTPAQAERVRKLGDFLREMARGHPEGTGQGTRPGGTPRKP